VTPYYADDWLTVYGGDCREVMRSMEPESVHCVVTSPPYWGLRDYGDAGQLGLEPTPEEYVANMVEVFREVRRVLRSDGTVWLNLGDSYAAGGSGGYSDKSTLSGFTSPDTKGRVMNAAPMQLSAPSGLKPKDLVGIPWRVAFALQADGWYLRSDIIWSKPNPMPESVTDRPTKSHEYLFLLSKSPRYYFDADAVREPFAGEPYEGRDNGAILNGDRKDRGRTIGMTTTARNIRSVWTIATQPYPGAHFATFPRKLVEPCIKAGTSERGVCPECGAPWVRETRKVGDAPHLDRYGRKVERRTQDHWKRNGDNRDRVNTSDGVPVALGSSIYETIAWRPSCKHEPATEYGPQDPIPAAVLDPFAGSGTTGVVAQSLGRRAVLIDLNPDYLAQAMTRNRDIPLGLEVA
jgi:DNA modification methylase